MQLGDQTIEDFCAQTQNASNPLCLMSAVGSSDTLTACTALADLDTYNLDNLTYGLAQGWHPTGYYTPQLIQQLVGKWQENSAAARQAVMDAWGKATPDLQKSLLKDRLDDLDTFDKQGQNYLDAASSADIVSAPKLKDWILGGLTAASTSLHAAEVVTCQHDRDWTPLVTLGQWLYTIGGEALDVVKAAAAAGKNVVQASEWLLGALGWVVSHGWLLFGLAIAAGVLALAVKHADALKGTFTRFTKRSA